MTEALRTATELDQQRQRRASIRTRWTKRQDAASAAVPSRTTRKTSAPSSKNSSPSRAPTNSRSPKPYRTRRANPAWLKAGSQAPNPECLRLATRPMELNMRLHKIKAGETAGTYLIESPVTEADILLMAKQLASQRLRRGRQLTAPQDVFSHLQTLLEAYEYEVFALLMLDCKHRVIAFHELFRGTLDGASVCKGGREDRSGAQRCRHDFGAQPSIRRSRTQPSGSHANPS